MNQNKYFKNKSIAIVIHVYAVGSAFMLDNYMQKRAKRVIFIGHPFSYTSDTRSVLKIYEKGELILEKRFIPWKGPEISYYLKDLLLTLWWIYRYSEKEIDFFIGADNLNSFAGYVLKEFGKVKKMIYYTFDYIPQRFPNRYINTFYHWLDRFMVEKSYAVWNLSSVFVNEREKEGLDKQYRKKQITVPIGTIPQNILPFQKIDPYKIVHIGHLLKEQGVELLVESMEDVVKHVPKARLLIMGGGPMENSLRAKIKKMKLGKYIQMTGFIKDFSIVDKELSTAAIGVAPYAFFVKHTDPGKPKDYLSHGLAVVITKIPQIALEIQRKKAGFAVSYKKDEIAQALITLLKNKKLLQQVRENASKISRYYSWENVYNRAWENTI